MKKNAVLSLLISLTLILTVLPSATFSNPAESETGGIPSQTETSPLFSPDRDLFQQISTETHHNLFKQIPPETDRDLLKQIPPETETSAFSPKSLQPRPALLSQQKPKVQYAEGQVVVLLKNPGDRPGAMAAKSQIDAFLPPYVTQIRSIFFEGVTPSAIASPDNVSPDISFSEVASGNISPDISSAKAASVGDASPDLTSSNTASDTASPGLTSSDTASASGAFPGALSAQASALTRTDLVISLVSSDTLSTPALIEKLREENNILYAAPNYRYQATSLSGDPYGVFQWGLENHRQPLAAGGDVNPSALWAAQPNGSGNVVAVVDTGVDYTHPDLKASMWRNPFPTRLQGTYGYDFFGKTVDPMDNVGHGSHVAGIIAASTGNGEGIAALDPGARIMALKVGDIEGMDSFAIMEAYEYVYKARDLGVPVTAINNSWGGDENKLEDPILTALVNKLGEKGVLSIFAAGNERFASTPLAASSPYQITVGASNAKGQLSDFSDYGDGVDMAAPGEDILSTVSYPHYNPAIYTPAEQAALSGVYINGDAALPAGMTHLESLSGEYSTDAAFISLSSEDNFGPNTGAGRAIKWSIPNAQPGAAYHLIVPYQSTSASAPVYGSISARFASGQNPEEEGVLFITDTKLRADGALPDRYKNGDLVSYLLPIPDLPGTYVYGASPSWQTGISGVIRSASAAAEQRAMVVTWLSGGVGPQVIYLDEIGVSNPVSDPSKLGKYAFYSGTSMAAPFVAAAAALVNKANPDWSAAQLAQSLRNMTTPVPALSGKVKSGGVLDLSRFRQASPCILTATKNKTSTVTIKGAAFGTVPGAISAAGRTLAPLSWTDDAITLPSAGILNKKLSFIVTTAAGQTAQATCYVVDGKPAFQADGTMDAFTGPGGSFATDGKSLFYVSQGYFLKQTLPEIDAEEELEGPYGIDDEEEMESPYEEHYFWEPSASLNKATAFPDATVKEQKEGRTGFETEFTWVNGKFYGVAVLNTGATACYALVSYDPAKNRWARVSDKPGAERKAPRDKAFEAVKYSTLASRNGKLYLLGGIDIATGQPVRSVRVFDLKTKKWTAAPDLPQPRYGATGRQSGNNLILTMGGDGTGNQNRVPPNLIFNGKSWSVSASPGQAFDQHPIYIPTTADDPKATRLSLYYGAESWYRVFPAWQCAVGLYKNGLIYSGLAVDGLGDAFYFNATTKRFTASAYQLNRQADGQQTSGISVGGRLWVVSVPKGYPFENQPNVPLYYFYDLEQAVPKLYSLKISSGLYRVKGKTKGGKVSGHGWYLPGQTAQLKATPKKGYRLTKFKVAGKSVKVKNTGATASLLVVKNTRADAFFKKYTTRVNLTPATVNAKPGGQFTLKASVTGAYKGKKSVTWKSSNSKYAGVSRSGKVTVKNAGLGHTVVITATAKDSSAASAKTTVRIFTQNVSTIRLTSAAKTLKVGKNMVIRAKINPAGALKTVAWSVSHKKYASITAGGVLTAKKAGKGKTITITAKATDGSKKNGILKIKIT